MRFTLGKLFLAVAMVALACAGMIYRTRWWADGIVTLTVVLFVVMAIRAVGLHGRDRAFAIAFAVVGGSYLFLVTCDHFPPLRESLITNTPLVLTAKALRIPLDLIVAAPPSGIPADDPKVLANPSAPDPVVDIGPVAIEYEPTYSIEMYFRARSLPESASQVGAFFLIGHCVWSWLFALLGGWFAGYMYSKREGNSPPTAPGKPDR